VAKKAFSGWANSKYQTRKWQLQDTTFGLTKRGGQLPNLPTHFL
jgi:hypothetical protein